jgi:hypothetical protein
MRIELSEASVNLWWGNEMVVSMKDMVHSYQDHPRLSPTCIYPHGHFDHIVGKKEIPRAQLRRGFFSQAKHQQQLCKSNTAGSALRSQTPTTS